MPEPLWLPLPIVERYLPLAAELGAGQQQRASRGFVRQYHRADGDPVKLSLHWRERRAAVVRRLWTEIQSKGLPLFSRHGPSAEHLELILWAYSPRPQQLR